MTSPMNAKLIRSLSNKKERERTKKFLVEGEKNVLELLKSDLKIEAVFATSEFQKKYRSILEKSDIRIYSADANELVSYGTLEHNNDALAIVFQKNEKMPSHFEGVNLVIDDIRDPGNLGTLIRIADWYGIKNIICSNGSVDFYNPKVINSTMGSFTRVNCYYADLPKFIKETKLPTIGTFLKGKSAHTFAFPKDGLLVLGSESHGISYDVEKCVNEKITIPSYGKAESLNIAIAGAIILDRWIGGR